MPIPPEARSHHTVWVRHEGGVVGVRYAHTGEGLVCFGDAGVSDVPDGATVTAIIREIADGPPIASFSARVRVLKPDEVDDETIHGLLEHVALGRTEEEVRQGFEEHRRARRIVRLEPTG